MSIQDQTELTKTVNAGTSIVTKYDGVKSAFVRASFQVALIGVDSNEYKGSGGNVDIETEKLSVESKQAMDAIDVALRSIWAEVKAGYPDYVEAIA